MTATVLVPRSAVAPRGAQLVGWVIDRVRRVIEQRRHERAAAAAEAVRRYARQIRATDPGMAADLLAAADRHVA